MRVHTIEQDFEYHIKGMLMKMRREANERRETFDSDWLWRNLELLGRELYEDIDEWMGIDDAIEELNR